MSVYALRSIILCVSVASMPGFAAAAGSQAGDNGRQPIGADNEGPRIAFPNANLQAGEWYSYDSHGYYDPYRYYYVPRQSYSYVAPQSYSYVAPPAYTYYYYSPPATYYVAPSYGGTYYAYNDADRARALSLCEARPLAERPACRDAVVYSR